MEVIMNKNVILTAFVVAVVSPSVSAGFFRSNVEVPASFMSKAYGKVSSFVGKNYKALGAGVVLCCGYKLYKALYRTGLAQDYRSLLSDLNKKLASQKSYQPELPPCDPKAPVEGELQAKNYPLISPETVKLANMYLSQKNLLLKPGLSQQEKAHIKSRINQSLAVFKDRVHRDMPLYEGTFVDVIADFVLRNSLPFETVAV